MHFLTITLSLTSAVSNIWPHLQFEITSINICTYSPNVCDCYWSFQSELSLDQNQAEAKRPFLEEVGLLLTQKGNRIKPHFCFRIHNTLLHKQDSRNSHEFFILVIPIFTKTNLSKSSNSRFRLRVNFIFFKKFE